MGGRICQQQPILEKRGNPDFDKLPISIQNGKLISTYLQVCQMHPIQRLLFQVMEEHKGQVELISRGRKQEERGTDK